MAELRDATRELGDVLYAFMTEDPAGMPSEATAAVFARWLAEAGPVSGQPERFADVAANYVVPSNSNKDLLNLFSFLQSYLTFEEPPPPPEGAFIPLRMAGSE